MNKAKNKAPPIIEDARKAEKMTNEQFNKVLELIKQLIIAIIPDIPERAELLAAVEKVANTK